MLFHVREQKLAMFYVCLEGEAYYDAKRWRRNVPVSLLLEFGRRQSRKPFKLKGDLECELVHLIACLCLFE